MPREDRKNVYVCDHRRFVAWPLVLELFTNLTWETGGETSIQKQLWLHG